MIHIKKIPPKKKHKHNAKLNKSLKVSIQSSSSEQIRVFSKSWRKKKKKKLFNVKNKHLIATRSCFVSVTIIRVEVDIKENSMQQNLGKQVLHSLSKDESEHFLNQWYNTIIISSYEVFS